MLESSKILKVIVFVLAVFFVFGMIFSGNLMAAEKKTKQKKVWLPSQLGTIGLSEKDVAKIKKLETYQKLCKIKEESDKKGLKTSSKEWKKFKDDKGWGDLMKQFKKDAEKALTSEQKKKWKEIQEENKKKRKKK